MELLYKLCFRLNKLVKNVWVLELTVLKVLETVLHVVEKDFLLFKEEICMANLKSFKEFVLIVKEVEKQSQANVLFVKAIRFMIH